MRSFEKTDDPFTRRKTTPRMVTPLNVSQEAFGKHGNSKRARQSVSNNHLNMKFIK